MRYKRADFHFLSIYFMSNLDQWSVAELRAEAERLGLTINGTGKQGRKLRNDYVVAITNHRNKAKRKTPQKRETSPKREQFNSITNHRNKAKKRTPQKRRTSPKREPFNPIGKTRKELFDYLSENNIPLPKEGSGANGRILNSDLVTYIKKYQRSPKKLSPKKTVIEKDEQRRSPKLPKKKEPTHEYGKLLCDFSMTGRRRSNEDTHVVGAVAGKHPFKVYGVFDGHSGIETAKQLQQELIPFLKNKLENEIIDAVKLTTAFEEFDEELRKKKLYGSGSCAIVAIIQGDELHLVNLGDSRGIVFDETGTIVLQSVDNKPDDPREAKRIKAAGGRVIYEGVYRVTAPHLEVAMAVSRAFGDFDFKPQGSEDKYLISSTPDVYHHRIRADEKLTIFLACDGLWDVFSSQQVADRLVENRTIGTCENMAQVAYEKGSEDNITTLLIEV